MSRRAGVRGLRRSCAPALAALVAAALLTLAACGGSTPSPGQSRPRGNTDILRADEIAVAQVPTAYDAIMRLRPRFLMGRGADGMGPRIYVDGYFQRSADDLRSVAAADIVYIRYLSAPEATTFWGTGFTSPVVYVLTRANAAGPRR